MFSLDDITPGHWYLVITCDSCRTKLALFRDLSEGNGTLRGTYMLTCPKCGHDGEFQARHHYQPLPSTSEQSNALI